VEEKRSAEKTWERDLNNKQTNLEFECYTRDKLIAQDAKNNKKFLQEQMKDQEVNKYYSFEEERGAPVDHSLQIQEQHEAFGVKEQQQKEAYSRGIAKQVQTQRERRSLNAAAEKEFAKKEAGFEFECFTRDKLVAQDAKNLKGFLREQTKEQQLSREYAQVQDRGALKNDDSQFLRTMQDQRLQGESKQLQAQARDDLDRQDYNQQVSQKKEAMRVREHKVRNNEARASLKQERAFKQQQKQQYAHQIKQQIIQNSSPYK